MLMPNVSILKPCSAGETYEFDYTWFKKSDPSIIIGSDERLLVDTVKEDYCLKVTVVTQIDAEVLVCTKIFCESVDEGNISPECFSLAGTRVYCFDNIGEYWIDTVISKKVNYYTWTVDGGQIISNPDSSTVKVKWSLNPNDTGKICVSYNVDCGTSCEKCKKVFFETKIAGQDFEQRGLSAYLDAQPNPNGMWRLISGPHQVTISDPSNPRTKITAYNYGYYCFEWTITGTNCTVKDTLCVDLYSFKRANPEYPRHLFDERSNNSKPNVLTHLDLFTPNLITGTGNSFIVMDGEINSSFKYSWYDIYGRMISNQQIHCEPGRQRIEINSPLQAGFYFLLFDMDGALVVKKVCVME